MNLKKSSLLAAGLLTAVAANSSAQVWSSSVSDMFTRSTQRVEFYKWHVSGTIAYSNFGNKSAATMAMEKMIAKDGASCKALKRGMTPPPSANSASCPKGSVYKQGDNYRFTVEVWIDSSDASSTENVRPNATVGCVAGRPCSISTGT